MREASLLRPLQHALPVALLLTSSADFAAAQNRGLVVNSTGEAHVLDFDSGAVLETIDLGGPRSRVMLDCEVSADGRFGYVADTINFGIWVIDLGATPSLASGTSFIPLTNPPQDMTLTKDGRFLVAASNSNIFFRLSVVDLETRAQIGNSDLGGMQSVEACDDGVSLLTTSASAAGARRFTIDASGRLAYTGDQLSLLFYVSGVCAPGSRTAVLNNFDTTIFGSAEIRSVSFPELRTLDVLRTGRNNPITVLLSASGETLYARMRTDLRAYRYDPLDGAIEDQPFFLTGGLSFVGSWAGGERMTLHPDGTRLFVTSFGRVDVFDTGGGNLLGSILGAPGGAICASPELVEPTVIAVSGGPYAISEGGVVTLSATGSTSPTGGTLVYEWDFDFDGAVFTPDALGETVSFDTSGIVAPQTIVIAVRVTDEAGNQTLETTTLEVLAVTLEADAGGPYEVTEGGSLVLSAAASTSSTGEELGFAWDLDGDGAFDDAFGPAPLFDAAGLDGPLSLVVAVRVSDSRSSDVATAQLEVLNAAPSIAALADRSAVEGAVLAVEELSFEDPSGLDTLTLTLDWGDASTPLVVTPASSPLFATHVYADNADYVVSVSVEDDDGGAGAAQFLARVGNAAPILGALELTTDPVPVGGAVAMSASFTDPGTLDTHVAAVEWGDGASGAAQVLESPFGPPGDTAGLSGMLSGEHVYQSAGLYPVTTILTDDDGGSDVRTSGPVVVFDPSGPFVTGGGWIVSPGGADRREPDSAGRANFGFVAKYVESSAAPIGQTEFQFHAGGLDFHAGTYRWLVIDGPRAWFSGIGRLDGVEGFPFLVTAIDGDRLAPRSGDAFRIQVWEPATGELLYDNERGEPDDTTVHGGSIAIHTRGAGSS